MENCFEYSHEVKWLVNEIAAHFPTGTDGWTDYRAADLLVQLIDRMITERLGGDA